MADILYYTKSLCPACLGEIVAAVLAGEDGIYMEKTCAKHGVYRTLLWQDTKEHYVQWLACGGLDIASLPQSPEEVMACSAYRWTQITTAPPAPCSAALMTTSRCNAACPVCFTRDGEDYMPTLAECEVMLTRYRVMAGAGAPLEFCGGEPTVREDLPELARIATGLGFNYIQLNTNGFRLAEDVVFCRSLREAGITTVYLGFEGVKAEPYVTKYGRNVLPQKFKAVEHCAEAGLAVVLVPCVIPGSNDDQLGEIIRYAKSSMPTVRGVYFQPVSYFGAYPVDELIRLTIPELLRKLEAQTDGEIRAVDFQPGACEHPQCSFSGYFIQKTDRTLHAVTKLQTRVRRENAYRHVRAAVKKAWGPSDKRHLTIGGMAFMDVWNFDMLRLSYCTIQIIGRDGGLVPLCAKYVTNEIGEKLLPGIN